MSKTTKILLAVGGGVLALGVIIYVTLLFTKIGNLNIETVTNTYTLEEFNSIDIDVVESNVKVTKSNDGINKIELKESNKIYHKISYRNDTIEIKRKSEFAPFEFMIPHFNIEMEVIIYLNENKLNNVKIDTVSGNLNISSLNSINLECESISGNILLEDANVDNLELSSVSAKIETNNVNTNETNIKTTSGKIYLNNLNSTNSLKLKTVSGKIEVNDSDAKNIEVNSVSGTINLNLKTGKVFKTKTVSGEINVPDNENSGTCEIETVSGNIIATIK